jgi:hypothetical protein
MSIEPTTEMPIYDWSRFLKRVPVKSDVKILYHWCSTRDGLEKWFLRKAIFSKQGKSKPSSEPLQQGDDYEWYWYGWSDEIVERGAILAANGTDRLKFTFGKAGDVTIVIKQEEGELLVELTQENIPLDDHSRQYFHLGCNTGWTFYLANLKSVLEGGIDLRNKNVSLQNVVNS